MFVQERADNGQLLSAERRQAILEALSRDGKVVAARLVRELGVSEDTIRRDLRELAAAGRLQRVHGGALPSSPAVVDFAGRQQIASDAKVAIGRAAAKMIRRGQVAILDGGTTTLQIARHLPHDLHATIVTHSPTIAVALVENPSIEVILLGGRLFKHSVVTVGAAAVEAVARIHADLYFMGVTGIHAQAGLSTGDLEESHMKRALLASAAETYVLASAEKIGAASPYVICPLTDIDGMVAAAEIPKKTLADYRRRGLSVVQA
jgi:DeoR/GlpR family transcriptional regulator of sugar metabolism